jgi:hypothetical protein
MAMIRYALLVAQVCTLNILVNPLFVLLIVTSNSTISFMYHKPLNLALIHRITSDNDVFFELHPNYFFVKDRESRRTLLQGRSKGGLYPLLRDSTTPSLVNQTLSANKASKLRWHALLGHPSTSIVRFVLNKNSLPSSSESSEELVCDSCQLAKSHQLPYPIYSSASKAPLELIFSDVWGPACDYWQV